MFFQRYSPQLQLYLSIFLFLKMNFAQTAQDNQIKRKNNVIKFKKKKTHHANCCLLDLVELVFWKNNMSSIASGDGCIFPVQQKSGHLICVVNGCLLSHCKSTPLVANWSITAVPAYDLYSWIRSLSILIFDITDGSIFGLPEFTFTFAVTFLLLSSSPSRNFSGSVIESSCLLWSFCFMQWF